MRIMTVLIFFVSIFACSQTTNTNTTQEEPAESPNINVTVQGLNGGQALLLGHFADQRYSVDTAQINANGQFSFTREEPYDRGFYFLFIPDKAAIQLLLDADQTLEMTTNLQDIIGTMQVSGNKDNELLYQSLKFEADNTAAFEANKAQLAQAQAGSEAFTTLTQRSEELLAERKSYLDNLFANHPSSFFVKFKSSGQNPEITKPLKQDGTLDTALQVFTYRTQFWDNVDFSDERLLHTPVISNKLKRYINDLTPQNPDSIRSAATFLMQKVMDAPEYYKFFANWITLQYEPTKTTLMDPEAVFVHMIQNYFTYEKSFWADSAEVYALQLRANEMQGSLVGNDAPNVTSTGPDGKTYSISDIKDPYIVVYMYNPTCEHCMEQTPKLANYYRQWKSQGIEVFAIAIDTEDQEWRDYIAKNNMTFINVFDPTNRSIYAKYYVDNTPEVYVINPERKIIAKNLNVDQVMEVIAMDKQ
jgi:peroxiredoxin